MALKFAVNNSLSAVTSLPTAISTGAMTLLQTQTASSSTSVEFTTGIDNTYDVYKFVVFNAHAGTDSVGLNFTGSTNAGSSYGVTKTTTAFNARHTEDGFDYVFIKCLRCGAELTFGEKKTGGVIYLRTNENGKPDWKELKKKQ